jgi:hypothetical protein
MRHRDFIKVIAGSAVFWPLAARAQTTGRLYRVGFHIGGASRLAELAIKHKLPMFGPREFAKAGGLVGYGPNRIDLFPPRRELRGQSSAECQPS